MPLRLRFLVILFFPALATWAQSPDPPQPPALTDLRWDTTTAIRYRIRSSGLGGVTLRDRFLSPLRYSGALFTTHRTVLRPSPRRLIQTRQTATLQLLTNGVNDSQMLGLGGDYTFSYFLPLRGLQTEETNWYVGGMANGLFQTRISIGNVNNVVSYDYALAVGPTGMVQQRFKLLRRTFLLTEQLSVPLLNLGFRSPYGWPLPTFTQEEGKFTDDLQVGSLNRYVRLNNQISLDFYWKVKRKRKAVGKNALRLTYQWEYFQVNRPNRYQAATSALLLGRIVKF